MNAKSSQHHTQPNSQSTGKRAKEHRTRSKRRRGDKSRERLPTERFTGTEQRAARGLRIRVEEAEPYGWMARSESGEEAYHLFMDPQSHTLSCTCADFIFRGDKTNNQCKHVIATLLFIATQYLKHEYNPLRQHQRQQQAA